MLRNILIIEDHQIIIDTYKMAIKSIENEFDDTSFQIEEAKNCNDAIVKIENSSKKEAFDIVFLDIQLPESKNGKIHSGECLGKKIRNLIPDAKIIVCTSLNDNLRLKSILNTVVPEVFLIKSDIDFSDIVIAIQKVILNENYYSQKILDLFKMHITNDITLNDNDILILKEIANGSKLKELIQLVPLTKSGIEKRRRLLRKAFEIKSDSDRELVLVARKKGFI